MSARELNKAKLVEAFRNSDWEAFKILSQERERIKRQERRHCSVCNVPLTSTRSHGRHGERYAPERCAMHQRSRLIMKPWLQSEQHAP